VHAHFLWIALLAPVAASVMMRGAGLEIVLVDRNANLAVAQARDILDATPPADPVRVHTGESADLDGARVVVLAAGAKQRPGESRLDLLSRNAEIIAEIVPAVLAATDPIFLVATNPLDVMTQIVTALAGRHGVAPERVIGSGTILDSARFRTQLAAHLGISPTYIDARVLGEHGDRGVLHWSDAMAGNLPVAEVGRQMRRELTEAVRNRIDTEVRRAAYAIYHSGQRSHLVRGRGGLARIAEAIERDERALITFCTLTPECQGVRDVALSLPRVLGAGGVVKTFMPSLDTQERAALKRSAEILKEAVEGVRL
jgi:L-lactate dehydrogenase